MEFDKPYNRKEFVDFLQNRFLPEDFEPAEEDVKFSTNMKYTTSAIKLGTSKSLDLVVYEMRHTSQNDARVSLSKEAFRMLANEMQAKALVIFVPEDSNDNYRFSLIEITIDLPDDSTHLVRTYSNPRRYSYLLGKGIAYYTPNKYLNKKERVKDEEDLRNRFSVDVLTKEFYSELSNWYAWAIQKIRFPNNIDDNTDNAKYNNEGVIRLITRLIFVWFLKQKELVPDEFFDEKYIADNLIDNFNPHVSDDIFSKSKESRYYKAILQNLFFAMLNSPITKENSTELTERHFRRYKGNGSPERCDYNNNKLMRYEAYFKNPQAFVDIANKTVPFLNGGLFDCLDDKDNELYYDGFSDREVVKKALIVPDYLFFGEEVGNGVDLSEWYGDRKKNKVATRGIIEILKSYNFTIEENTPFDQEVSLDPELLGKVFENLLASYNPETQTTARKQTGSFYTPREIVQYMVDESLVAHLKRTVGEELESQYRQLLKYTDDEIDLTEDQRKQIMKSLYECKILDPACGSGAFPMGMLQQMVHILNRIDPDNSMWKKMIRNMASNASYDAYQNSPDKERKEILSDIERSFDEGINRPDYARKLYLIENCIYGVDIQPIAIQISKLRFFISLVVDQKTN
ncbi:MAG: restriction endonuclease subunit M, partial [Prevotella sp.]|nr:restriction endonuclease subunit M [Prevotella sp.]